MPTQTLVERHELAETYADSVNTVHLAHLAVRIELAVNRPKPADQDAFHRVPVARLVLAPQAAIQLYDFLRNAVESLEKAGFAKRVAPGSETKQ